jgi:hypothetical protein
VVRTRSRRNHPGGGGARRAAPCTRRRATAARTEGESVRAVAMRRVWRGAGWIGGDLDGQCPAGGGTGGMALEFQVEGGGGQRFLRAAGFFAAGFALAFGFDFDPALDREPAFDFDPALLFDPARDAGLRFVVAAVLGMSKR